MSFIGFAQTLFTRRGSGLGLYEYCSCLCADSLVVKKTIALKKLVWVFLRGALDSLHTVVPIGDPNLAALRGKILAPIQDKLLRLISPKNRRNLRITNLKSNFKTQRKKVISQISNLQTLTDIQPHLI